MTSYIQLIEIVQGFFDSHGQVKRFNADFLEQFDNYSSVNEKYPIVFMSLNSVLTDSYLATFTIELHCLDVIQKDRKNINLILSDTHLILQDFYRWLKDGDRRDIYPTTAMTIEPLNNAFCDYLAGCRMTLDVEVNTQSYCELPINISENFNPISLDEETLLNGGNNIIIVWQ